MSRVGRKVIPIPKDVKVQIEKSSLQVQGPKGKLTTPVPPGISFKLEGGELSATRTNDERQQRAFHGLARALANNAIRGVTEGLQQGARHRRASASRPRSRATRSCSRWATPTRWCSPSRKGSRSRWTPRPTG